MRIVALVAAGWIGSACVSSRTTAAATPTTATTAAPAPSSGGGRTQEFAAPTERNERLHVDELPPAFAQLSPRDRERWHACHIFFLTPLGSRHPASVDASGYGDQGGLRRPRGRVSFSVTPAQYVETAEAERRAFLIRHGCPDSLVDLADGTHLDMIEQ